MDVFANYQKDPETDENGDWSKRTNSRGHSYIYFKGKHVTLSKLKEDLTLPNDYLQRNPRYPESVAFHLSDVCHVTEKTSFERIINDGGFRKMYERPADEDFLWWSLSVSKYDIAKAEENFLNERYNTSFQPPFLKDFTKSPAFQSSSRYGNFKFTLPLKELLYQYARQFCRGSSPVLRVMDTRIYKQEIMYSVLVHPRHVKRYCQYPRLPRTDRSVCWYSQKQISWRCQSPSNVYHTVVNGEEKQQYYVWDHVAVAFHLESNWTFHVSRKRLLQCAEACMTSTDKLLKEPALSLDEAREIVANKKKDYGI